MSLVEMPEESSASMVDTKSVASKMKARPIVRLGIFLISHSFFVSVICCIAGVLALLLLPVLAKNTYISENALVPGSATPMLSAKEVSDGNNLVKDIAGLDSNSVDLVPELQQLIARYMSDLGSEVNYHKFYPQINQFHPLHFFSGLDSFQENASCSAYGVSTVGIIRAPRGDGKEAIVLVTPYNFVNPGTNEALSLGIAYSVFSLLSDVTWLAKDIIWLVADSRYGEYVAVSAWLRDYHNPKFGKVSLTDLETCSEDKDVHELKGIQIAERKRLNGFRRAGTMAAALVIKVSDKNELYEDSLSVYAEASNGQMPNLDLINVVNYLAVHRQRFRVKVEKLWYLLSSKWLKITGEIFDLVGQLIRSVNPQWKFGIPGTDYIEGAATLASSLYYQALGVPTGSHGAFRDYQVDAITIELSPKISSDFKVKHGEFLMRSGRLVEGVVRSVNNLLEKFHQSFFLYMLTSPSKFLSVGVYMIAFALLVAPLPIVAASLYVYANTSNSNLEKVKSSPSSTTVEDLTTSFGSWKWLSSAKSVFVVHLWGAVVSLLPYFICQLPNCNATTSIIFWTSLSILNLLFLNALLGSPFIPANSFEPQVRHWACLKSVTISAAFTGLCLMSVINFATAEIGALLIVPMCLLVQPLRFDCKVGKIKTLVRASCNLVFVSIGFPPAGYFILKGVLQGFSGLDVGDFWNWMETLWAWNSATFLFVCLVQLPCWVLCVYILLYPC